MIETETNDTVVQERDALAAEVGRYAQERVEALADVARLTRELSQAAVRDQQSQQIIRNTRRDRDHYYNRLHALREQVRAALTVLRSAAPSGCHDVIASALAADDDASDEAPSVVSL